MPSQVSTPNLTTYDLLKSLALLLMLLDHVGYYFYPENDWLRAIGRASLPIWFFLVGFARSRDLTKPIWIGAIAIVAANVVFGGDIFPLNILFTIIITRLVLDVVSRFSLQNWEAAIYGAFALSALMLPTMFVFEYGSAAILIAMSGYLARHAAEVNLSDRARTAFMAYSVVFYAFTQLLIFGFDKITGQFAVVSIGAVAILLWFFRPKEVPEIEERLPKFVTMTLQFGGRYTLEIYAAHVILFKLACCIYGLKGHGWFSPQWIG